MLARLALITVVWLATVPLAAALSPCTRGDLPDGARCGTVSVPLTYDAPADGDLALNIIVLPARGDEAEPDPVFYLVGGPGIAATDSSRFFRNSMTTMQKNRDLVLFDLRGTGQSGTFDCALTPAERRDLIYAFRSSEGLKRCARDLQGRGTLRTTVFAHDIDRVRQAIGAERINLLGASYGTRLALEYARLYPDHVRTSVLRGVTSPAEVVPAQIIIGARKEFAALARQNPDLSSEYARLVRQLTEKPVSIPLGSGGTETIVDGMTFEAIVRFLLYDPRMAQSLPFLVDATAAGELAPLGRVVGGTEAIVQSFSIPVLLGVLCAEDVPFWNAEESGGPFAPALVRDNAIATCQEWSVPAVTDAFKKPTTSDAPTLLLSGEHDPATPADIAEGISKSLTNSLHLVTPVIGHFPTWTGCYSTIVAAFLDHGDLSDLDVSCAEKPPGR